MKEKTRTIKDGYVWLIISKEEARVMFELGREVCKLYDDGSEGLVQCQDDIDSYDGEFGTGVGFIRDLMPTCPMCGAPMALARTGNTFYCNDTSVVNCKLNGQVLSENEMEAFYEHEH